MVDSALRRGSNCMGLGTVMNTALSGMSAASVLIDVTANNLANSRTPGFKASRVDLATQGYATLRGGTPPVGNYGGTNPLQVGQGVMVRGTSLDLSQGSIEMVEGQPALLALEGEGFFI